MSGAIKMEGFQPSSGLSSSPSRPSINRPFSDGSMTVESSILSSLMNPPQQFSFQSPLPSQSPTQGFDYNMVSPHSSAIELPGSTSPHSFQPHAMFNHLNFNSENREPPVVTSSSGGADGEPRNGDHRSRSQSSSRSSHIGKAPPPRSRSGRKLSMSDVRPSLQAGRGRTMQPPRSMSFHTDTKPNMLALGAQRANSVTSAEYNFEQQYGLAIPRHDFGRSLWGPAGSAPSTLPEGVASFDGQGLESPVTPAQGMQALLGEESRKQRRRECHNQVEKRRREHINAMIEELNKLLPAKFKMPLDGDVAVEDEEDEEAENTAAKKKKSKRAASSSKQKDAAQCKGRILSDSVQYIRDLQAVNEQQSSRIRYLEGLLVTNGANPSESQSWTSEDKPTSESAPFSDTMQGSPEAEQLVPLPQASWNGFGPSNSNMLVFETSPTEASSGPENQRSTPVSSGSPETDNKDSVVWGLLDLTEEQRSSFGNEYESHRKDDLQQSLSNMEIEVDSDERRPWGAY